MKTQIRFKKKHLLFSALFCIVMIIHGIWFVADPQLFIRNFLTREIHIQGVGIAVLVVAGLLLIANLFQFVRPAALYFDDAYFIDYTKLIPIGKIKWVEVSKISKVKKNSLKIQLKSKPDKRPYFTGLKLFYNYLNNYNGNNSIIISSVTLECNIDKLEGTFKSYLSTNETNHDPTSA